MGAYPYHSNSMSFSWAVGWDTDWDLAPVPVSPQGKAITIPLTKRH